MDLPTAVLVINQNYLKKSLYQFQFPSNMWDMLQTTQNDNHRPTPALRALSGFILILCLYEDFHFFMIDECQ